MHEDSITANQLWRDWPHLANHGYQYTCAIQGPYDGLLRPKQVSEELRPWAKLFDYMDKIRGAERGQLEQINPSQLNFDRVDHVHLHGPGYQIHLYARARGAVMLECYARLRNWPNMSQTAGSTIPSGCIEKFMSHKLWSHSNINSGRHREPWVAILNVLTTRFVLTESNNDHGAKNVTSSSNDFSQLIPRLERTILKMDVNTRQNLLSADYSIHSYTRALD